MQPLFQITAFLDSSYTDSFTSMEKTAQFLPGSSCGKKSTFLSSMYPTSVSMLHSVMGNSSTSTRADNCKTSLELCMRLLNTDLSRFVWSPPWLSMHNKGAITLPWSLENSHAVSPALLGLHLHHDEGGGEDLLSFWPVVLHLMWMAEQWLLGEPPVTGMPEKLYSELMEILQIFPRGALREPRFEDILLQPEEGPVLYRDDLHHDEDVEAGQAELCNNYLQVRLCIVSVLVESDTSFPRLNLANLARARIMHFAMQRAVVVDKKDELHDSFLSMEEYTFLCRPMQNFGTGIIFETVCTFRPTSSMSDTWATPWARSLSSLTRMLQLLATWVYIPCPENSCFSSTLTRSHLLRKEDEMCSTERLSLPGITMRQAVDSRHSQYIHKTNVLQMSFLDRATVGLMLGMLSSAPVPEIYLQVRICVVFKLVGSDTSFPRLNLASLAGTWIPPA